MKRIFVSFAIEDRIYRDGLVKQAKDNRSPFEFVDMSVKEPWNDSWKTRCRTKIKGCDGIIALISNNTKNADGARWEIKSATTLLVTDNLQLSIRSMYSERTIYEPYIER